MEAKDTVSHVNGIYTLKEMDRQAEISFKAGIREVVEWLEVNSVFMRFFADQEWYAKLKDWGIE